MHGDSKYIHIILAGFWTVISNSGMWFTDYVISFALSVSFNNYAVFNWQLFLQRKPSYLLYFEIGKND